MEGLDKIRESSVLKRRGLLAGATALGAAMVANLGTTKQAEAADGDNMRVGVTNNSSTTTSLVNSNTTTALFVQSAGSRTIFSINTGTGTAILAQGQTTGGQPGAPSGIQAESGSNSGVIGTSQTNAGVYGQGAKGCWGQGLGQNSVGVYGAITAGASGALGGLFDGPVVINGTCTINGDFGASGMKSAIVKNKRGQDVRLFAVEAPESFFEDYGVAGTGADGSVFVQIAPDFAEVIKTDQYLVFVTAYGRNNGLFVEEQNDNGFRVRDSGNQAGVNFAWRVIAKRGDLNVERFAPVSAETRGLHVNRGPLPQLVPNSAPPTGAPTPR